MVPESQNVIKTFRKLAKANLIIKMVKEAIEFRTFLIYAFSFLLLLLCYQVKYLKQESSFPSLFSGFRKNRFEIILVLSDLAFLFLNHSSGSIYFIVITYVLLLNYSIKKKRLIFSMRLLL